MEENIEFVENWNTIKKTYTDSNGQGHIADWYEKFSFRIIYIYR